jgi:creatinine amidohydrolase
MLDGIFQDTMANMKWTDIQFFVDQKALVLLPLGVIEEHGPHLCLGTDIYIAHQQCMFIKKKLEEKGFEAVIAPPFYWGICQATGSFIGSFSARKDTVKAMLFDILASLDRFGFRNVFGVSGHGDIEHSVAVMEAFREANEQLSIRASFTFPQQIMVHYDLTGSEPHICPVEPQTIQPSAAAVPDVHGGDMETAVMYRYYPNMVDTEQAKALPPMALGEDWIMTWLFGGHTKELSENGYLGAPADFERFDVSAHMDDVAVRTSRAILKYMS